MEAILKKKLIYILLLSSLVLSSCSNNNIIEERLLELEEENNRLTIINTNLITENENAAKKNQENILEIASLEMEIKLLKNSNNELKEVITSLEEDYTKIIVNDYSKVGYIDYLKTNLKSGKSKEEILQLIEFDYVKVLPVEGVAEMWRFDIGTNDAYQYESNVDSVDLDGLSSESVSLILFLTWSNKDELGNYAIYYKNSADGLIKECSLSDNEKIKEIIINN